MCDDSNPVGSEDGDDHFVSKCDLMYISQPLKKNVQQLSVLSSLDLILFCFIQLS